MEQRAHVRKLVSVDAVIGCSRFGLIRGRVVDLGMGGLYIRAETSIVPIRAAVVVTCQFDEDCGDGGLSLNGRVVHQSLHGFGIQFVDLDVECRRALGRRLPLMPPLPLHALPALRAG